jgi:hypothetical protein
MKNQDSRKKGTRMRGVLMALALFAILGLAFNTGGRRTSAASPSLPAAETPFCGPMDVAFVIDNTGSMSGAIGNVKSQVGAILDQIVAASGGDYRLGLISFGDTVTVRQVFANQNRASFEAQLGTLNADEDSDGAAEEASDEALNAAINGGSACQLGVFSPPFRTGNVRRIVVLVTDIYPAGCDHVFTPGVDDTHANQLANQALQQGIQISAVYVPTEFNGSSECVPPFNPGLTCRDVTTQIMQNYATISKGSYQETAPDGDGTSDAIQAIISECGGGGCVLNCPDDVHQPAELNQCTAHVTYTPPTASNGCGPVNCAPPSGSVFQLGATTVTCTVAVGDGSSTSCSFRVVVDDTQPPKFAQACPAQDPIVVENCTGILAGGLSLPAATDTCSGPVTVRAERSDGQSLNAPFPVGFTTTLTYIATDQAGNSAFCVQHVLVKGAPQVAVSPTVDFGQITFQTLSKKKKKGIVALAASTKQLTISNTGCGTGVLTLRAITRQFINQADRNKFRDADASQFYVVRIASGAEAGTEIKPGDGHRLVVGVGQISLDITFSPQLPRNSNGANSNLTMDMATPDPFESTLELVDDKGTVYPVNLTARIANDVHFINPNDIQRGAPFINFTQSGDTFTVEFYLYDADTGGRQADSSSFVKSAKYEFLGGNGDVVQSFDVDLAGPVEAANLARGQRFKVTKTFSGANSNSVSTIRVTVTDGKASPSLEASLGGGPVIQALSFREEDFTITLPADRLGGRNH